MKVQTAFKPLFGQAQPCLLKSESLLKDEYLLKNEYREGLERSDLARLGSPAALGWLAACRAEREVYSPPPEPRGERIFTAREELDYINRRRLARCRGALAYLPTMPRANILGRRA